MGLRGEVFERGHAEEPDADLTARFALPDALAWLEQAVSLLKALPQSPSNLEHAFELRLKMGAVLLQLGQLCRVLSACAMQRRLPSG